MILELSLTMSVPDDLIEELGRHRVDVLEGYVADFATRILTRAYRESKGVCCEKKKVQKKKKLS